MLAKMYTVVLEMRLYAMYRTNPVVICILLALIIGESTAMGVLLGIPNGFGEGSNL